MGICVNMNIWFMMLKLFLFMLPALSCLIFNGLCRFWVPLYAFLLLYCCIYDIVPLFA